MSDWDNQARYAGAMQTTDTPPQALSYGKRLELGIQQAEARLADLRRMQALFQLHPDFEELLTLVQRNGV